MYNEKTVFVRESDAYGCKVRFNTGELAESKKFGLIEESTLYFEGDINDAFDEWVYLYVYRVYDPVTGRKSGWYLSRDEAQASELGIELGDYANIEVGTLQQHLFPTQLPLNVSIQSGEKGLYVRLNMRPDLDGSTAAGKFYFPDRSCAKNLIAGHAIVTEVTDKGSYGFFKAHMVKYQAPSEAVLAEYLEDERPLSSGTVEFMSDPYIGDYIRLTDNSACDYIVADEAGYPMLYNQLELADLSHSKVVRKVPVWDIIYLHYTGYTMNDFWSCLLPVEYADRFDPCEVEDSPKFVPPLLERAGIGLCRIANIDFVDVLYLHWIDIASKLSHAELDEVIEAVNSINSAASEAVIQKVRKGKLRLARVNH